MALKLENTRERAYYNRKRDTPFEATMLRDRVSNPKVWSSITGAVPPPLYIRASNLQWLCTLHPIAELSKSNPEPGLTHLGLGIGRLLVCMELARLDHSGCGRRL